MLGQFEVKYLPGEGVCWGLLLVMVGDCAVSDLTG